MELFWLDEMIVAEVGFDGEAEYVGRKCGVSLQRAINRRGNVSRILLIELEMGP